MTKPITTLFALLCLSFTAGASINAKLELSFTLPRLAVSPYHRPYVVAWVETRDRKYVTTLALWADDKEWHKDLRQWWRRAGRDGVDYDGVTSATRKPGDYQISWTGGLPDGGTLPPGDYLLNVEVSREEGGRSFFRQPITWDGSSQKATLADKGELHNLTIELVPSGQ